MIVASSCDNVELLLSGKVDELNCITGYTDCEVCVLFLLGVLHSVDELLLTEYVYVEVVCTLIKVTVEYVNQVGYALRAEVALPYTTLEVMVRIEVVASESR